MAIQATDDESIEQAKGGRGPNTVQKLYITDEHPDGIVRATADELIRTARLHFKETGYVLDLDLDEMADQHPNWYRAAAAFGALTAASNAASSARTEDDSPVTINDRITASERRFEQFRQGEWSAEAAGPGFSDIILAYSESQKKQGVVVTDLRLNAMRKALEAKELTPKRLLMNNLVKVEFTRIKAERAADRLEKVMAQAREATDGGADLEEMLGDLPE